MIKRSADIAAEFINGMQKYIDCQLDFYVRKPHVVVDYDYNYYVDFSYQLSYSGIYKEARIEDNLLKTKVITDGHNNVRSFYYPGLISVDFNEDGTVLIREVTGGQVRDFYIKVNMA